jgi:hypothetical protein
MRHKKEDICQKPLVKDQRHDCLHATSKRFLTLRIPLYHPSSDEWNSVV